VWSASVDTFSPYPPGGNPFIQTDRLDFDNWSYRAILNWQPSDDTLLFAGVNQTHKAGNWNLSLGFGDHSPHAEEELRSYEIGIKTDLMGGKVRLNATAFYYDYKDFQAFVVDPGSDPFNPVLDVINVDAEAYGGELELSAYPMEGLYTALGVALMDSTVKDVTLPDLSVIDSELPFAPNVSLNGLVRYSWLVADGEASIQFDFNYNDDFIFSVLDAPMDQEDSYLVGNVRASYTFPNERWSITAFATNVFEEEYRLYSVDTSNMGLAADAWGDQRLFGVTVEFAWN
jgi:iron complex outermembrane receptor protein